MKRIAGSIAAAGAALALAAPAEAAIECGDTITQDRKLQADLANCAGTGLFIDGNEVTLDMNGHEIRDTGDRGIEVTTGSRRVTIKDGTIRNAGTWGVIANDTNHNLKVRKLTIISPGSRGLQVSDSKRLEVRDTEVRRPPSAGFYLSSVTDPRLEDVAVKDALSVGMDLTTVQGFRLVGASITGDDGTTGVSLSGQSANVQYRDMVIKGFPGDAGYEQGDVGSGIILADVTVSGNDDGFLFDHSGAKLKRPVATGNDDDGLLAGPDALHLRITDGRFGNNGEDGIQFLDGARGGIGNTVANGNGDYGIEVPASGVRDLGGNSARNNETGNCINIDC
jgi:hypothetical protein